MYKETNACQPPFVDTFKSLNAKDVVSLLKRRFEIEKISRHCKAYSFQFKGQNLRVSQDNSLLLEFPTLKAKFPEHYDSPYYRLLLLLDLRSEADFRDELRRDLTDLYRKRNIDKLIIWSCSDVPQSKIQALKDLGVDLIWFGPVDTVKVRSIKHFIPIENRDCRHLIALNIAVDLLLKRLKKLFHLILSEIAAPIYNKKYGSAKVATSETMKFEEGIVAKVVDKLRRQGMTENAIDVGCGTGRHSFALAKVFKTVYAFDFSPRMIEEANKEKRNQDITNIYFSVADLEYEKIVDEDEYYGKADLVLGSFGMGSFIEDSSRMLQRFYNWLKSGGYAVISFYNSESLLHQVKPSWRDTSLAAHLDTENKTLRVELISGSTFHIYCKPFSPVMKGAIKSVFGEIECIYTYPTLMALMPNTLLENSLAKKLFVHVDSYLATHEDFSLGHYVTVIVQKKGQIPVNPDSVGRSFAGHKYLFQLLQQKGCRYEIISHEPVLSIEDVKEQIGYFPRAMVKTVIFKSRVDNKLIVVALLSEKRVHRKMIAQLLGIPANKLSFAPEKDLTSLGFQLGGVPPFGYPKTLAPYCFLDKEIISFDDDWLYMGIGENNKTLKIARQDFLKLTKQYKPIEIP